MSEATTGLAGAVVLVTGAGRGIGRAIARAMAAAGARVVVNDAGTGVDGQGRDRGPAEAVAAEIGAAGGAAVANVDSVADEAGAARMVAQAIEAFGRLDAVVNNAGILRDAIFHKMTVADFRAVVEVHLIGAFQVSRAAAAHFRARGSGAFVHLTSTSGLIGNLGQANYAAAKMGIVGLSRAIALDMARFGVRSNCLAPFARSRMIGSIPAETAEARARIARFAAMTPEKVAPLAVFLASPAAHEVTGQIFAVRGNEIFLMSQPRPVRGLHAAEGWTPESLAARALPALRSSLVPLEVSGDVFAWDPV